jgi:hypothetical protein
MYPNQFNLIHDKIVEVKKVIVHDFRVSDSEDPDLYAAEPLIDWQNSEQGQWIMNHAVDQPEWHRMIDQNSMGWNYVITAKLTDRDFTFWTLKWNSPPKTYQR